VKSASNSLVSIVLAWLLAAPAFGASIAGTVKSPDGKPFMGAFVIAENSKNKMSVSVLSDALGRFRVPNLPATTYTVRIRAIGYQSDSRPGVALSEGGKASLDFVLQKDVVRWSDLNTYQGTQLLPKTEKHDLTKRHQDTFFSSCLNSCHSFQTRMASAARDLDGWRTAVKYMRDGIIAGEGGGRMTDERVEDFAAFLAAAFSPQSPKPSSPADLPEYYALVRPFNPRAMNIVYVEYDFAGTKGLGPWSAVEDKNGMLWIPYYGRGNEVVRLDPNTAELARYPLPFAKTAGIHSAFPAPDGTVWFTEAAQGRIGHLNPLTKEITEYANVTSDGRRVGEHTIRFDESGHVWTSGGSAISLFDPGTKEFTHFDAGGTYGNALGKNGDHWFTTFRDDGPVVRITKNGEMSKFYPPTKGKPQRIQVDSDGIVWFSERVGNRIGRFDPHTETFKEFPLPGPQASPYALALDRDHMIWYASHEQDLIGRLDSKTGEVIEYPFPHSEISIREFFQDSQGRLWFASSSNNKVGYFYLDQSSGEAGK
jgi:streptogramin lyase